MMNLGLSDELVVIREKIRKFVEEKVEPVEHEYHEEVSVGDRWSHTPRQDEIMEGLKQDARNLGLWNFFLPKSQGGAGISNLEYAHLAEIMSDLKLNFEVIDSTHFNPEIPPFSVLEQQPRAFEQVKRGRKIYLTLNPSTYRKVSIPNVVQVTYRNAVTSLRAVGLEVGKITYRNNIGKDMVLALRFEGDEIEPGEKIPKSSKVDLVLGNGKRGR